METIVAISTILCGILTSVGIAAVKYYKRAAQENIRYAMKMADEELIFEAKLQSRFSPTISPKRHMGTCPQCGAPINPHREQCDYCDCYYE